MPLNGLQIAPKTKRKLALIPAFVTLISTTIEWLRIQLKITATKRIYKCQVNLYISRITTNPIQAAIA